MRYLAALGLLTLAIAFRFGPVFASPTEIDQSFHFADPEASEIRDIELFPDGIIAYGGTRVRPSVPQTTNGLIGKATIDGTRLNLSSGGWSLAQTESLALDYFDGAIFGAGPATRFASAGSIVGIVSRYAAWERTPIQLLLGTGRKVLLLPDRKILIAGDLSFPGETNRFGLLRMDRRLAVDQSFDFMGSAGIDVTTAGLLANGGILAGYQFTNESGGLEFSFGRWGANGLRDSTYVVPASLHNAGGIAVIEQGPNRNGFIVAVKQPGEQTMTRSVLVPLDETGSALSGTHPLQDVVIEGTVNAIAFEAIRSETVASGDYDRIIVAGDFKKVGDTACNNLVGISKEGLVEWFFPTNEGPNAPIQAVAVQLDGKILIGGAFTNVNGIEQNFMARLMGNYSSTQTHLFWADAETRAFEKLGRAEVTLLRSGNTNDALSVSISTDSNVGGINTPIARSTVAFAAGETAVKLAVTIPNDSLRQGQRIYAVAASVTDTNVLVTRARTELIILDDETPDTINPTFQPMSGLNATNVETFAIQPDRKVIVAYQRITAGGNGTTLPVLIRLNSDGSLDPGFATNTLRASSAQEVRQIFPQLDGKIYIAGVFLIRPSATPRADHLARLNSDGTWDSSFNPLLTPANLTPPLGGDHTGIVVTMFQNGDLLVWPSAGISRIDGYRGIFRIDSNANPVTYFTNSSQWRFNGNILEATPNDDVFAYESSAIALPFPIKKFNTSGIVDSNFVVRLTRVVDISDMKATGDSLLIAGRFTNVNDHGFSNIARVSIETGALDTNFHPLVNGRVRAIDLHDDKIYIGGDFTAVNGKERNGLARLNADGSLDETFDPGFGPNEYPARIELTPNGDLMVGISFDRFDGIPISPLALLEGDEESDVLPVSVQLARETDEAIISYWSGSLQASTNLIEWDEVHRGGGQFRTNLEQSRQFFRSAP